MPTCNCLKSYLIKNILANKGILFRNNLSPKYCKEASSANYQISLQFLCEACNISVRTS